MCRSPRRPRPGAVAVGKCAASRSVGSGSTCAIPSLPMVALRCPQDLEARRPAGGAGRHGAREGHCGCRPGDRCGGQTHRRGRGCWRARTTVRAIGRRPMRRDISSCRTVRAAQSDLPSDRPGPGFAPQRRELPVAEGSGPGRVRPPAGQGPYRPRRRSGGPSCGRRFSRRSAAWSGYRTCRLARKTDVQGHVRVGLSRPPMRSGYVSANRDTERSCERLLPTIRNRRSSSPGR